MGLRGELRTQINKEDSYSCSIPVTWKKWYA